MYLLQINITLKAHDKPNARKFYIIVKQVVNYFNITSKTRPEETASCKNWYLNHI